MQPTPTEPISEKCIPRDIMLQAAMIRLGEIDHEVNEGYNVLRKYHRTATIFGSARTLPDHLDYHKAIELGAKLSRRGFAVVTGGGHGIMGAANRGAKEAGGDSIGFNIKLPHEQTLNEWTTESLSFSHFAPRKIVMTLFANAYIYFPGGFGTLDELTEILTLVQTGKTTRAPIILVGSGYWSKFDAFIQQTLRDEYKVISPGDEQLYTITDDISEVVDLVLKNQTYCEHELPGENFETKRDAKAT